MSLWGRAKALAQSGLARGARALSPKSSQESPAVHVGGLAIDEEVGKSSRKAPRINPTGNNFSHYLGPTRLERLRQYLLGLVPESAKIYLEDQKKYWQEHWEESFEVEEQQGDEEETGHKIAKRDDDVELPPRVKARLFKKWARRSYILVILIFLTPGLALAGLGLSAMTSLAGATQAECRMSEFQPKRNISARLSSGDVEECSIGSCELIVTAYTKGHGIFTVDNWLPEYTLRIYTGQATGVLLPVHEQFRCCPQPAECCGFFGGGGADGDPRWCDNKKVFDASCPAGPWDCYFYNLDALLEGSAAISAEQLHVGNINSFWPALAAGAALSGVSVLLVFGRQLRMFVKTYCKRREKKKPRSGKLDRLRKSDLLREYAKMLGKVAMFQRLRSEQLYELAKDLSRVEYKRDDYIIVQGDDGDVFYILYEGEVVIDVDNNIVAKHEVDPREETEKVVYFGERSLIRKETRAASVKVTSVECTTLTLTRELFEAYCEREKPPELESMTQGGLMRAYSENRCDIPPPMGKAPVPRGLLYDTGDSSTFRRTARVSVPVQADADGNARIEVALDAHSGELGAKLVEILTHGQPPHVRDVRRQSLAELAGLEIGDMLVQVNGHLFPSASAEDLIRAVLEAPRPLFLAFSRWPRGSMEHAEAVSNVNRNSRDICSPSSPAPPRRGFAAPPPRGAALRMPSAGRSTKTSAVIDLTGDGFMTGRMMAFETPKVQRPPRPSYASRFGRRAPRRGPQVGSPRSNTGSSEAWKSEASEAPLPGQLDDQPEPPRRPRLR